MNKIICPLIPIASVALWTGMPLQAAENGILTQIGCAPNFANRPFYHSTAVRKRQSGAVLVEFSVSQRGEIQRPVVIEATAPHLLQSGALEVVKNFKCKPGKDWTETGGPERRLRLNVLFKLNEDEAPKLIDEAAEVVTVAAASKRPR
jgi:TonB family protein